MSAGDQHLAHKGAKKSRDISRDSDIRKWMREEITIQLREMKEELNREIVEDMKIFRISIVDEIMSKITADTERKLRAATARVADNVRMEIAAEMDKKIEKSNNQIVARNNQQLVRADEKTREMVAAVGQQICETVYGQIMTEINENVVPKVNNMVQWVNYNMQDGGEVVDRYRREVESQHRPDPNIRLLTDGKTDKRIISSEVRLFFGDD